MLISLCSAQAQRIPKKILERSPGRPPSFLQGTGGAEGTREQPNQIQCDSTYKTRARRANTTSTVAAGGEQR